MDSEIKKIVLYYKIKYEFFHTWSWGDNDCVIWLLQFVVVDDSVTGDGVLDIWDVESMTRWFDIVFIIGIFEWCWLDIVAIFNESVEDEYVPLDDGDPVVFVVTKPDDVEVVNNVGIKG